MYINFKRFGLSFCNGYDGIFTIWTNGQWYLHFGVKFKEWRWGKSKTDDLEYCGFGPVLLLVSEKS